jgi:hypothetical protein
LYEDTGEVPTAAKIFKMTKQLINPLRKYHHYFPELYSVWGGMRNRCNSPTNAEYLKYGGRGIKVCERWNSYENFYNDMMPRPRGKSIDRINNDGNYEPSNCRWASQKEQCNNTRANIKYQGKSMSEWARIIGVDRRVIYERLKSGWEIGEAMTTKKLK